MEIKELRSKTDEELRTMLKELREKTRVFNFGLAEKKLRNVGEISQTKRAIARILTLLRQRTSEGKPEEQTPLREKALEGRALLRKKTSEGQAILNKKHDKK
ncbi:MAG: 50S ribosomal protein L29 [Candidatus Portnoybacteria bacterium]|nr:50S ribosomal protein L29 [Candidatus Portnoybacteria bacterium]